jgi:hypothetical protein
MNKISNKSTDLYGDYDFYVVFEYRNQWQLKGHRKDNGRWEKIEAWDK